MTTFLVRFSSLMSPSFQLCIICGVWHVSGHRLEMLKRWRTINQTEFQLVDSAPPVGGVEWKHPVSCDVFKFWLRLVTMESDLTRWRWYNFLVVSRFYNIPVSFFFLPVSHFLTCFSLLTFLSFFSSCFLLLPIWFSPQVTSVWIFRWNPRHHWDQTFRTGLS